MITLLILFSVSTFATYFFSDLLKNKISPKKLFYLITTINMLGLLSFDILILSFVGAFNNYKMGMARGTLFFALPSTIIFIINIFLAKSIIFKQVKYPPIKNLWILPILFITIIFAPNLIDITLGPYIQTIRNQNYTKKEAEKQAFQNSLFSIQQQTITYDKKGLNVTIELKGEKTDKYQLNSKIVYNTNDLKNMMNPQTSCGFNPNKKTIDTNISNQYNFFNTWDEFFCYFKGNTFTQNSFVHVGGDQLETQLFYQDHLIDANKVRFDQFFDYLISSYSAKVYNKSNQIEFEYLL